jgi:hypothetical protein
MHGLEIIIRLNRERGQPKYPGTRLRHHPRIAQLRSDVAGLPIDEEYRRWVQNSLDLYADHIINRPLYKPEDGWDDLEALQQIALGDMMEASLRCRML